MVDERRIESQKGAARGELGAGGDAGGRRICHWCKKEMSPKPRRDKTFCSRKCRQAAFRIRRRYAIDLQYGEPKVMAYADPPFPGKAYLYKNEPEYEGEVDHVELIARLRTYDGWALSTSSKALRDVLPLCPDEARVCSWGKPIGVHPKTRGLHSRWEALIVVEGRKLQPGVPDWLSAQPARYGGNLIGRKPIAFVTWMFRCLGLCHGDTLIDFYPGTGIVSAAWDEINRFGWPIRKTPGE